MIGHNYGKGRGFAQTVDWTLILCYLVLIFIGWLNVAASVYDSGPLLDFTNRSGSQFIWIMTAIGLAAIILFIIPPKLYEPLSAPVYIITIILLVAVIFLGTEHKGSRSWFDFGAFAFQPAEISKIATALMLATYMGRYGYKMSNRKDLLITLAILALPMVCILAENETGSVLVYVGFIFMLYREGLSGWIVIFMCMAVLLFITTLVVSPYASILLAGAAMTLCNEAHQDRLGRWLTIYLPIIIILVAYPFIFDKVTELNPESFLASVKPIYVLIPFAVTALIVSLIQGIKEMNAFKLISVGAFIAGIILTFSVDIIVNNVLQEHQRKRIEVLLGLKDDPNGVGYNVRQSMIAIGSGGVIGKGYLNGTQTKGGFVPEQSTDFIFCTIGEEWGFLGSAAVILLYVFLIWRIIRAAENSRENFTRIYGYCVACCIFMHLMINIGMTIGLMPVIGIPLPFLSYGGSSLWSFTILLFIFIALERNERRFF